MVMGKLVILGNKIKYVSSLALYLQYIPNESKIEVKPQRKYEFFRKFEIG